MRRLERLLRDIDGRGYKAYKDIKGSYNFGSYILNIIKVQGDPFASPSLLSCEIDLIKEGYSKKLYDTPSKKLAFEDYFLRKLGQAIRSSAGRGVKEERGSREGGEQRGNRYGRPGRGMGSGKSGNISILKVGQEIIKRSAVEISGDKLTFRFYLGLPARGRTVLGREAKTLLFDKVKGIYEGITAKNIHLDKLERHVKVNERSDMVRRAMAGEGLISFIGEGSILARKNSVDDRPMTDAVRFKSPGNMLVKLKLEDGTTVEGMGIKRGITTITGGGFHGKSTLLNAIEKGVYNHIPGDGRELVITTYDAVKIRAEDGRSIEKADISTFINNLPHKKDTKSFTSENASGSTSQACNIMEAIELGAKLLLIDEDTSATNFMVRDRKIQELISHDKEPITPFIEKVGSLRKQLDVSTIIVVGGLGDYFSVSDNVLMLDEYRVTDITKRAKEIDEKYRESKIIEDETSIVPGRKKLNGKKIPLLFNDKKCKIRGRDLDELSINKDVVDIRSLEQFVENGQVPFVGELLKRLFTKSNGNPDLRDLLDRVEDEMKDENICNYLRAEQGSLVFTRKYEVGAVINRIRRELFL
ncbi:ATPase [Propionigenium maris DSM 9537]|uniref:ATPase n=1 Tax=Propionigenium maris DSM 9537 TaxID=1123000 RepID=A0A9W6GMV8_9FUSO|nr:ABC-ATPase domain-containing protein [Propionigenium maris]GLI56711.1 ATPase [Propionigenium maris DSM 9537]